MSFLSSYAAHLVLQGRFDVARLVAAMVSFFEEFKAVIIGERAKPNTTDLSKLKLVVSFLLCNATDHVLEGDIGSARHFAQFVPYFEAFVSAKETGEIVEQSWAAILDLCNCDDEHTLVKYLRKRIPCTCLDEKYEEVKSKSRMGVCFTCKSAVERSKVLTCSQCGTVNYCGRKCQKAHWHGHKEMCAKITCSKMTLNVMDQL